MGIRTCKVVLAMALTCFTGIAAGPADAGFIEIIGFDPRSTAMGGAAAGVADNPSAWYYNPAGLAQIKGNWQEFSLSQAAFLNFTQKNQATGFSSNGTAPTMYNVYFPGTLDFGIKDLMFGFGGGTNFGGIMFWSDKEGYLRYSAYQNTTIIMTLAPAVAYRLTPWLMIGGAFEMVALNQATSFLKLGDDYIGAGVRDQIMSTLGIKSQQLNNFLKQIGINTQDGHDDGKIEIFTDRVLPTGLQPTNDMKIDMGHFSYNLGVLFLPTERLRIGITYREEIPTTYAGPAHLVVEDAIKQQLNSYLSKLGQTIQDASTRWSMDVIMPRELVLGFSYRFTDSLLVATDFQWTNWSNAWAHQSVYLEGNGFMGVTQLNIPRNFRDTFSWRLGAEYKIWKGLRCQAGYWYDPSPVPDSTMDVATIDADRQVFSCGLGYYGLFNGLLDISWVFQFLLFETRDIPSYTSKNLGGSKNFVPAVNGVDNGPHYNDFPLEISGNVINLGILVGVHY